MRTARAEWAKRVERWVESGLTAKEFAAEVGINPRSLVFWKWQLKRDARVTTTGADARPRRAPRRTAAKVPMIELRPSISETRIELELSGGRLLKIPSNFDVESLRQLLAVLETRS